METQQTYAQMLGMAEAPQNTPQIGASMSAVMDPMAGQMLAQVQRPAQSPAELEARKTGWAAVAEKLSDPNLLRALGFAGAAMAQPGGTFGHGLATGMTAFQAGEYGKQQQDIQQRVLGMKERESEVGVEATQAGTEIRRAQLPGVRAESQVAAATATDKVDLVRTQAEVARFKLKEAKGEAEIDEIERGLRKRKAEIMRGIPDARLRAGMEAELDKAIADVESKRAAAAENRAQAGRYQAELKGIKDLSAEELQQYFTRTGKFAPSAGGGAGSARLAQDTAVWEKVYDKIKEEKPDDPQIKGITKYQFVRDRLVKTEDRDTMNALVRAMPFLEPGSPEEARAREMLQGMLGRRDRPAEGGGPPPPAAGGGKEAPWLDAGGGMEYRMVDGKMQVRRKAAGQPSGVILQR